jgi:hypothetical protein
MSFPTHVDTVEQLSAILPIEDHFSRSQQGRSMMYLRNEGTIRWLNKHLGLGWSWEITNEMFQQHPELTGKEGDSNRKVQWLSVVSGQLTIADPETDGALVTRAGVGAGINFDPDTAVKTALAEALKKASNQFGIGLYLWQPEMIARVEILQGAAAGRQAYLVDYAINAGVEAVPESIAGYYGVTPKDMKDDAIVTSLITELPW